MIDRVDKMLWRWAASVHTTVNGLGYPSATIEYRIMREGEVIRTPPQSSVPSFRIDHELMELNRAVESMRERWRNVIKTRYLCGMGEKDGAAFLGMSVGTFRRDLDLGHAWLAGRLGIP